MEEEKNDKKSIIPNAIGIVVAIIILGWVFLCVYDYISVFKEKDPTFCIKNDITSYDDGKVYICYGLGYKVFKYNRETYKGYEFGPLWTSDRSKKVVKE